MTDKQLLTCATGNCAKLPLEQEYNIETTASYAENNVVWIEITNDSFLNEKQCAAQRHIRG
jgi:hypothetical protein